MTNELTVRPDRWGRGTGARNPAFEALYDRWFRVEWNGLEHLPTSGGALLVSNHAGLMPVDGGVITLGVDREIGRPVYSLAHHGFWRFPFIGSMVANTGGVVGHPENAQRLLAEEKQLVLVFPEGAKGPVKSPRERYRLQRFGRGGFVETALRAGVPIVPIVLMGTEDTTPVLAKLSLAGQEFPLTLNTVLFGPLLGPMLYFPAKIRAQVLPPVHYDEPPDLDHYPRSLVMERAEDIRTRMQTTLNRMLQKRESVIAG